MNQHVVSVEWLQHHYSDSELIILDVSPSVTADGRNRELSDRLIPNARIVDMKKDFSSQSNFPNTLPSAKQFQATCQALGINSTSKIVVYDNLGIYTSPRVWWLFKIMGHKNISVLDGGLPAWINQRNETINKKDALQTYSAGDFISQFDEKYLIHYEDVLENSDTKKFTIVDARSSGRFNGTEPEPRDHLKSGHIPHSINIPYRSLLVNGMFKTEEELNTIFKEKLNSDTQYVFSCGSGITACIVMLACEIAFKKSRYLYDGSWSEYAELQNLTH